MKIGFGAPVSGVWATPENLASFAASAEAAGYASLWTFQRLMVPEGSAMDPVYHSVLDPMVSLGYLAAVTQRIRLGVAVVNMPYVAPGYLAKMAATADVLSGGRLDLGLGIGWMPEEFTVAGGTMARRGRAPGNTSRSCAGSGPKGRPSSTAGTTSCPRAGSHPSRCSGRVRRS